VYRTLIRRLQVSVSILWCPLELKVVAVLSNMQFVDRIVINDSIFLWISSEFVWGSANIIQL
jgi:hypothetical protein